MASQFTLNPINTKTKGEINQLRRDGFVPVSVQHKGMPTAHYKLEAKPLDEFIRRYGEAALVELVSSEDKRKQRAIVSSMQRDPLTQKLLHVTFQQVRRDDTVKTHVPLVFVGEPEPVRHNDAILQHQVDRLEIECDPASLPDHINVNVADLQMGGVIRVSDLPAQKGCKILTAADTALASLASTHTGITETAEPEADIEE